MTFSCRHIGLLLLLFIPLCASAIETDAATVPDPAPQMSHVNAANSIDPKQHNVFQQGTTVTRAGPQGRSFCVYPKSTLLAAPRDGATTLSIKRRMRSCPKLLAWFQSLQNVQWYYSFASADSATPASALGHTFLTLRKDGQPWLAATTISYAAAINDNAGSIAYLSKGLTGGYRGAYTQAPLALKVREYGVDSSRDIYLFHLKLLPAQKTGMLLSLWESRQSGQPYYFISENCSSILIRQLTTETGITAIPRGEFGQVLPIETIRLLRERGLISDVLRIPSLASKTVARHRQLNLGSLRPILNGAQKAQNWIDAADDLPAQQQRAGYLLSVVAARLHGNRGNPQRLRQIRADTTRWILAHPVATTPGRFLDIERISLAAALLPAHRSERLSIGSTYRDGAQNMIFSYRPAFHDATDVADVIAGYSEIEALNLELKLRGHDVSLQRFTLIHIDSVPLDGGFLDTPTQHFSINYAPDLRDQHRKRWTVRWGRGRAYNIGSSAVAWWNMIANLRVDDTQRSLIGLGATLQGRFIWDVSAQLRLTGTLSVAYNPSLSESQLRRGRTGLTYRLSRNSALYFSFEHQNTRRVSDQIWSTSLRYYY